MRTSNMIYQAAVAHQTDLRRTAAHRARATDRSRGHATWIHLFSAARARQAQAPAAGTRLRALTRSVSV
jgi:hypothetical protein